MSELQLGKLVGVYAIAPAYVQRAVIIAVVSFVFFLATLAMFSVRQNFLYFFLSTAFLVTYLLTMFGWLMSRKNILKLYENGLTYRKFTAHWDEIETVAANKNAAKINCEIQTKNGKKITLTESIQGVEQAIAIIEAKIKQ